MQFPKGFEEKYRQLLGEEAGVFFDSFDEKIEKGYRVNPMKIASDKLICNEKIPYTSFGYFGVISGKSIEHTTGVVYSQEPSAQFVAEVASPKPNEKVLDLCAAPGGKTTHLASFLQNTGLLVSNEIMPKRAKILVENIERFGVRNCVVTNETPKRLAKQFPQFFDRILVDAPCSGEGMFRKDFAATQYWREDYPQECARLQREILHEAMKMLKNGGELIYSTCTFSPEENEETIAWLLHEYPELTLLPIKKYEGMSSGVPEWANGNEELTKCVRLFPHKMRGEGHFVAKLRKEVSEEKSKKQKFLKTNLTREQVSLWRGVEQDLLNKKLTGTLYTFGSELYLVPSEFLEIDKLKIARLGLHLGTFKKNRLEPSFALGVALSKEETKRHLELSEEQFLTYVSGNTVLLDEPIHSSGFYQILVLGNGLGFAKVVRNVVKNFYPKGLRVY
ncbi:NOL1/NOP2/sun family putative RNA methylase [Pilibacter termitis]|jgi:NOL1/NOP2/sun family putative RNA methylase|uniref:NOL1/NOP2/sun family putative RNA methylase n=1 Tax=Pilibacter termitis TaxID=263852 RepID=A0A1T4QQ46_9ENTE|nr:RsmB/NOP family class I SAM-dependent RNA methyltransferase [Pilibacter termitis]SKA05893.1 NOL1/NOP2/sun family putative RNA methylase [Pilibacter termitis]